MMRNKIWLNVWIMRLAIGRFNVDIFSKLFVQSDMQTNLSVEIQRSFQEYPDRTGSGNHYVCLYELQISRKYFLRNVLKLIGLVGL